LQWFSWNSFSNSHAMWFKESSGFGRCYVFVYKRMRKLIVIKTRLRRYWSRSIWVSELLVRLSDSSDCRCQVFSWTVGSNVGRSYWDKRVLEMGCTMRVVNLRIVLFLIVHFLCFSKDDFIRRKLKKNNFI
jgi:hypothetical protein